MGDDFLHKIFKTFIDMKADASDGKRTMPYIYDYYHLSYFMENPLSSQRNTMANIYNSLICTLNMKTDLTKNYQLPRFIIVIPEADILKHINYFSYGISTIIGKCLNWIITEMERVVDARKDELRRKNPGAVAPNEPKIIWVAMMNRPHISYNDMMSVCTKYNKILRDLLAIERNHYFLDFSNKMQQPANFLPSNRITARGKEMFWNELDLNIERFDCYKIKLHPDSNEDSNARRAPVVRVIPNPQQVDHSGDHGRYSSHQSDFYRNNCNHRHTNAKRK